MIERHSSLVYRALVLRKIGIDPDVTTVSLDSNLKDQQVLVRVLVSGICGKQLEEVSGACGPDIYLPHLLGHEGCGVVEEIGPNVANVKCGDLVVLHWITEFSNPEFQLPKIIDLNTGDRLNGGPITTFSEFTVVSSNRVTRIPRDVSPRIASLLGCGLTTGLGAVFNEARIKSDDRVLVVGCGGVGLSIVQGCRVAKASLIAAIDLSENALMQATLSGAHETFKADVDREISDFDLGRFSHVFYCIGSTSLLSKIHSCLSSPSKIFLVGVPSPKQSITINARHVHQRKSLHGSYGGMTKPSIDIPLYLNMIQDGLINPSVLLSKTYSISETTQAFTEARSGTGRRIQFCF